ncbi:nonstructural protein [Microviridae sp.]|nr:nonstructural protein [Microviridae sp.]
MLLNVYVIHDNKAQTYAAPMFLLNDSIAMRVAHDLRHNLDTDPGNHPEDFSLHKIGTYENTTAQFQEENMSTIIRLHEIPYTPPINMQQMLENQAQNEPEE